MATDVGEIIHEVKESPWRFGVIYYDPTDRRLVVRHRIGLGWTLNMANPIAWVLLGLVFVGLMLNRGHQSEER